MPRRRGVQSWGREPFWGVAWGRPSRRGRQRVHVVNGTARTCVSAVCGADVMVPATALDRQDRPMVTCGNCRRISAAHLILATRSR